MKKEFILKKSGILSSLVIGMAFGFGWTPCIGPILGSILALASTEQSLNNTFISFLFFRFSNSFYFIWIFNSKIFSFFKKYKIKMNIIMKTGGALLL